MSLRSGCDVHVGAEQLEAAEKYKQFIKTETQFKNSIKLKCLLMNCGQAMEGCVQKWN